MLGNLLESDARTARRTGGGVVSLLLHCAAVVALVVATAYAGQQAVEDTPERIKFVPVVKDEPPPVREQAPPPDAVAAARRSLTNTTSRSYARPSVPCAPEVAVL